MKTIPNWVIWVWLLTSFCSGFFGAAFRDLTRKKKFQVQTNIKGFEVQVEASTAEELIESLRVLRQNLPDLRQS